MIGQECLPKVDAEVFISKINSPEILGYPLVHTQHFIGAFEYKALSQNDISASYQIRAAHQRYDDPGHTSVAFRGHEHGKVTRWYKKYDGQWKLSGVRPQI